MDYQHMCPKYERAMEILSKKWTGLIVRILLGGKKRFGEFRTQMPEVSDRLLSERLQYLELQGILERRVCDTKPVRVEYELTGKGRDLEPIVIAIQDWGEHWSSLPEMDPAN
jgi:DNA-binding HxlR family transcriptional regulator